MTVLGRLTRVDLREVWPHEAYNFTPWMAQSSNLAVLSEELGLDLELVGQEVAVGPYAADIVCKDIFSGAHVLIENQLEKTDHSHLGQILTYAAALEARSIVWIASRFTDEHRAAIDWLNEITHDTNGGVPPSGVRAEGFGFAVVALQGHHGGRDREVIGELR